MICLEKTIAVLSKASRADPRVINLKWRRRGVVQSEMALSCPVLDKDREEELDLLLLQRKECDNFG